MVLLTANLASGAEVLSLEMTGQEAGAEVYRKLAAAMDFPWQLLEVYAGERRLDPELSLAAQGMAESCALTAVKREPTDKERDLTSLQEDDARLVRHLLACRASVNEGGEEDDAPLLHAINKDLHEVLAVLVGSPDFRMVEVAHFFWQLCWMGKGRMVRTMLRCRPDETDINEYGRSSTNTLWAAVCSGSTETAKVLLEAADAFGADDDDVAPLLFPQAREAIEKELGAFVGEWFLEGGGSFSVKREGDRLAFHAEVEEGKHWNAYPTRVGDGCWGGTVFEAKEEWKEMPRSFCMVGPERVLNLRMGSAEDGEAVLIREVERGDEKVSERCRRRAWEGRPLGEVKDAAAAKVRRLDLAGMAPYCRTEAFRPLWMACRAGHERMVRVLLFGDENAGDDAALAPWFPKVGLSWGGEIDRTLPLPGRFTSPFGAAMLSGNMGLVRLLLRRAQDTGLDVDKVGDDGDGEISALQVACSYPAVHPTRSNRQSLQYVDSCTQGAGLPSQGAYSAEFARESLLALLRHKFPAFQDFLQGGSPPAGEDCSGLKSYLLASGNCEEEGSPLWWACHFGNMAAAQLLLGLLRRLEVPVQDWNQPHNGRPPLWIACCNGHVDIVRFLAVEQGLDILAQQHTGNGCSCMGITCAYARVEVLRLLLAGDGKALLPDDKVDWGEALCKASCTKHGNILMGDLNDVDLKTRASFLQEMLERALVGERATPLCEQIISAVLPVLQRFAREGAMNGLLDTLAKAAGAVESCEAGDSVLFFGPEALAQGEVSIAPGAVGVLGAKGEHAGVEVPVRFPGCGEDVVVRKAALRKLPEGEEPARKVAKTQA